MTRSPDPNDEIARVNSDAMEKRRRDLERRFRYEGVLMPEAKWKQLPRAPRASINPPITLREFIAKLQEFDHDLFVAVKDHYGELCEVEIVGENKPFVDGPAFLVLQDGGMVDVPERGTP